MLAPKKPTADREVQIRTWVGVWAPSAARVSRSAAAPPRKIAMILRRPRTSTVRATTRQPSRPATEVTVEYSRASERVRPYSSL